MKLSWRTSVSSQVVVVVVAVMGPGLQLEAQKPGHLDNREAVASAVTNPGARTTGTPRAQGIPSVSERHGCASPLQPALNAAMQPAVEQRREASCAASRPAESQAP